MLLQLLWLYFPKVNFQIIITTHSPISLSDIPKSNVVFIDKNPDGSSRICDEVDFNETFAANIHSLYNNSFFLEGIPIGSFAKRKVGELYDRINKGVLSDNIIEDIYRIGEPIIRGVLLKLYDEKRKSSKKSERIKMLQKELSKLEEEVNND
jgi:predicted ATP-binding protein involved in virulence